MLSSLKIRKKFINFFKKRGHILVESASLIPQDDPSVLFTTAGMQQLKRFFTGENEPESIFQSRRLISIQRCLRTSDIESVGDETHNTFFEMLGNFSLGDYFKKEAIQWAWEFLTREMKINKQKLYATYFKGDETTPEDKEAQRIWLDILPKDRIFGFSREDNWWGPVGQTGPCGPSSEIHYDLRGKPCERGSQCIPNCPCHRFLELWNLVFTEYRLESQNKLKKLPKQNIDTGMGLERLALAVQKKKSIYETDLFQPIMEMIHRDKNFGRITPNEDIIRSRIIADHLKAAVFLVYDGVFFSNKEQGYILRRIFRKAADQFSYPEFSLEQYIDAIVALYHSDVPYLQKRSPRIKEMFRQELENYKKILSLEVDEALQRVRTKKEGKQKEATPSSRNISADEAFTLYTSYGLSPERLKREGFTFDEVKLQKLLEQHREVSRIGSEKKFGGHGLTSKNIPDNDRQTMTKLHTATHLLQQALRDVLGDHVRQEGSDISPERLRFDFQNPAKLTDDEKKKVEAIVNEKILTDLPVHFESTTYEDAIRQGALAFFKEKYPAHVTVYSVGDYSKEICGGPHVQHTAELGRFKIVSEKSVGTGIRRIKAVLE